MRTTILTRYVPMHKHLYDTSYEPKAIEAVRAESEKAVKVIINGQMYIRRGDELYSITGARIDN